jgi:hypothetical protein
MAASASSWPLHANTPARRPNHRRATSSNQESRAAGAGKKRKRGGQPEHKRHEQVDFPLDMIDEALPYALDCCTNCNGHMMFSRHA